MSGAQLPGQGPQGAAAVQQLLVEAVRHHQSGALEQAEALYRRALALDPRQADALHLLGVVAHQQGRSEAAIELIGQAIALNDKAAGYHGNLGHALRALGRSEEAVAAYRRMCALQPDSSDAQIVLGNLLLELRRAEEALACYQRAASLSPGLAEAQANVANALWLLGRRQEAVIHYERAIALKPDFVGAHLYAGMVLRELGLAEEALAHHAQAVALAPGLPEAHYNLAESLRHLQRIEEAIEAYRRAIAANPDFLAARNNLGTALYALGRLDEAQACYEEALQRNPRDAGAHLNLGMLLREKGELQQAAQLYRRALDIDPGFAPAWNSLGVALRDGGRVEEAVAAYRRAIALMPAFAEAHSNLAGALQELGRSEEALAAHRAALAAGDQRPDAHSNLIMSLHYGAGASPEAIFAEARRYAAQVERHSVPTFTIAADPGRRLRIGYVSGNFHLHPVGYFLLPALACHDRERFEIFCYSNNGRTDDMTDRLRGAVEHWRDIPGRSDEEVATLIRKDEIDILVDLSGHTELNRLPLFARRPAPVQASWLGYWSTTGLSSIDYIISDAVTVPPGEERWYSERVIRLEGGRFCYAPPDFAPAPAVEPPSVRNGYVTFGSFNNLAKIGPEVIRLWASVLQAVPGSRLLLKWRSLVEETTRAQLTAAFAALGIAAERLELRAHSPHATMLGEYADMDVALDPFPFSGGLTSCEAMWMGVPVVTWPQGGAPSRQAAGFLRAVGHADWAAGSVEEYVRIAAALAADEAGRTKLRHALRPQMAASPLCDGPLFARRLEDAYRQMWEDRSRAGSQSTSDRSATVRKVLHVGCGVYTDTKLHVFFRNPDWREIRLDINPRVKPDIVASITDMSVVPTGSVDAIYSSHNLEHLYPHEVAAALAEFKRVLAPDGVCVITLPDLQSTAALIAADKLTEPAFHSPSGPVTPLDILYGWRPALAAGNHFMAHRTGFTRRSLAGQLLRAGFPNCSIQQVPKSCELWAVAFVKEPDPSTVERWKTGCFRDDV